MRRSITLRRRRDRAEKAVSLAVGAGREVKRVGARVLPAAEGQGPQSVDGDRLPLEVAHRTEKISVRVERIDPSVAEIPDENVAAESSESIGCARNAPRRIQRPTGSEALEQIPASVKHVDKAVARPRDVVMLCCVLLRVGDEQIAVDVLNAERRKAWRNLRIGKSAIRGALGISVIKHVDRTGAEIGRKEEDALGIDSKDETFVNRAGRVVSRENRLISWGQTTGPSRNSSVLSVPDKGGRQACSRNQEACRGARGRVPDEASGRCRGGVGRVLRVNMLASGCDCTVRQRDLDLQGRCDGAFAVVQCRATGSVVRNPKGARGRSKCNTPRILQYRIGIECASHNVRGKVGLHVTVAVGRLPGVVGKNWRRDKSHSRNDSCRKNTATDVVHAVLPKTGREQQGRRTTTNVRRVAAGRQQEHGLALGSTRRDRLY